VQYTSAGILEGQEQVGANATRFDRVVVFLPDHARAVVVFAGLSVCAISPKGQAAKIRIILATRECGAIHRGTVPRLNIGGSILRNRQDADQYGDNNQRLEPKAPAGAKQSTNVYQSRTPSDSGKVRQLCSSYVNKSTILAHSLPPALMDRT